MTAENNYWQKRMAALEEEQYQRGAVYYKDVQKQFHMTAKDMETDIERWYRRLADNNDLSYTGAKQLLKDNELEEFHWSVEQYIKAGKENAVDKRWMKELENASVRHHISYLDAMKLQAQQHAELLSAEFEGGMTDYLHKAYGEQYYHTAFEMAKGTGLGTNLAKLDSRKVDAIIKRPWAQDGANFSDRIWANKDRLVNSLHTELTQSIIRGTAPQKAIDNLKNAMDVSRSNAGRLVMTESAAIASAAQKDCLKELGVEQYQILATLDDRTSQICQDLDGEVFDMKDYKVGVTAPPFHPNCRTTTAPYFQDEFTEGEERAARGENGETVYVPADMKYGEWKKQFIDESPEPRLSGQKTKYVFTKVRGSEKAIAYMGNNGVKFIYPQSYNKNQQKISPEKAMKVFERVPKSIAEKINSVGFVDYPNPKDEYWAKKYGIKGFVSYATGGNREITFYANGGLINSETTILETYLHEGGHIFDQEYKKSFGVALSETEEYIKAIHLDEKHNGRKYISDYAEASDSRAEDFADFIMGYFTDQQYYNLTAPNRTKLIKEALKL